VIIATSEAYSKFQDGLRAVVVVVVYLPDGPARESLQFR